MSRFGNLEFGEHSAQTSEQPLVKDGAYYLRQAEAFFRRGRFEEALRSYAKVLEFDPRSSAAWLGQARMLIELEEFDEAKLWADKGLEIYPEDPELLAAKAVALARSGDLKGAISFSDAAIESKGNTPYVWLARGDVLLARKEKRADYCFEKALVLGGADWVWRWLTARVQSFYKNFARGLALAREAVATTPGETVLWLEMGRCQMGLGMSAQAHQSFEHAGQLDPESDLPRRYRVQNDNAGFLQRLSGAMRRILGK
jgi:Flp pilus assembly protein TadD